MACPRRSSACRISRLFAALRIARLPAGHASPPGRPRRRRPPRQDDHHEDVDRHAERQRDDEELERPAAEELDRGVDAEEADDQEEQVARLALLPLDQRDDAKSGRWRRSTSRRRSNALDRREGLAAARRGDRVEVIGQVDAPAALEVEPARRAERHPPGGRRRRRSGSGGPGTAPRPPSACGAIPGHRGAAPSGRPRRPAASGSDPLRAAAGRTCSRSEPKATGRSSLLSAPLGASSTQAMPPPSPGSTTTAAAAGAPLSVANSLARALRACEPAARRRLGHIQDHTALRTLDRARHRPRAVECLGRGTHREVPSGPGPGSDVARTDRRSTVYSNGYAGDCEQFLGSLR